MVTDSAMTSFSETSALIDCLIDITHYHLSEQKYLFQFMILDESRHGENIESKQLTPQQSGSTQKTAGRCSRRTRP